MRAKWCIPVLLFGLLSGLAAAQQVRPPDATPLRRVDTRVAMEFGVAPLPPAGEQEPIPQPPGEPGQPLGMTLAELEKMAVQCNPTLIQAAARVQSARGQAIQAGLYPNPVVGYQGSEIGNEGRAGQQGGFVGQEIVTAGKLHLNQAVAGQAIRQAECAWATQRFRVLTDVRQGFYEVLVAQHSMELSEQLVRLGDQGVNAADKLMKAGELARVDVLQAKIEADSAKILLAKAKNRHAAAWRSLAAVVGNPAMQPVTLSGNLQEGMVSLSWEETLNRLLACSPQLGAARAGVAHAQAVLSRENAGRIPNIDLQAGVQFDNATSNTIAGFQVGVPFPVYNRNQGNIYKAQAELTAAQREVERVQLALQQRLATVFEQYTTARQQIEKYNSDILPNAEESLKLVSLGFQKGEFSYLVLLTSQRTYFQTNLAYLDALRELRAAGAAIEGNLLADSLQSAEGAERSTEQKYVDPR
jgi:outer membrane protein, heavy metal efflux system